MKSTFIIFFLILGLLILSSCRGDGSLNEEGSTSESSAVETQTFDPANPPFQSDRDPNVVYVDTEYLIFDANNTINYKDRLLGREIRQHQFDLGGGEIISFHITSLYDRTMVTIIDPKGQRLVRTGFGGPDDPFRWNERFNDPGLYTVQLSIGHDVAAQGHWTEYEINIQKSFQ